MNFPINKQRVRESFDRAAAAYDESALIQRRICERLIDEFILSDPPPLNILDAGCGTGFGAQLMQKRWPKAEVICTDFAPSMLKYARKFSKTCCAADIEYLPFISSHFDLWWSNLTIQWCELPYVFSEAKRILKPGGYAVFSTLVTDTFFELRQAFAEIDDYQHTLSFCSQESINKNLLKAGFNRFTLVREKHTIFYPDLKFLLRAIKAIGANTIGQGGRSGMMGRSSWVKLQATYEEMRGQEGLPITYDVILGYVKNE